MEDGEGKEREAKASTDQFNMGFISVWEIDARCFKLCGGDWGINEWYRASPLSRPRETPGAEADGHHRQAVWPTMHMAHFLFSAQERRDMPKAPYIASWGQIRGVESLSD